MKARLPQSAQGQSQANMMKQYQKLQEDLAEKQSELELREYEGTAGGGNITAVVTGQKVVKSMTIKPEIVDVDDIEMLEDLIVVAINEALKKAEADSEKEMGALTGGLNIPGM